MPYKIQMPLADMVNHIGDDRKMEIMFTADKLVLRTSNGDLEFEYVPVAADKKLMKSMGVEYSPRPRFSTEEMSAFPISARDVQNILTWTSQGCKTFTATVGDRYRWSVK